SALLTAVVDAAQRARATAHRVARNQLARAAPARLTGRARTTPRRAAARRAGAAAGAARAAAGAARAAASATRAAAGAAVRHAEVVHAVFGRRVAVAHRRALPRRDARAAAADLPARARRAVVDDAVAVVIDAVARLARRSARRAPSAR